MANSKASVGGNKLWIATLPVAFFGFLALIARVVAAFGQSQQRGFETLWAVGGTVVGLPLLLVVLCLPIVLPHVWRARKLARRFPGALVLTCQKADGLDKSLEALGPGRGSADEDERSPDFYVLVVTKTDVSVWRGIRDPRSLLRFPLASLRGIAIEGCGYIGGKRRAIVLTVGSPDGEVQLPVMPRARGWGGLVSMSSKSLRQLASAIEAMQTKVAS
jgi:hypothetical protein